MKVAYEDVSKLEQEKEFHCRSRIWVHISATNHDILSSPNLLLKVENGVPPKCGMFPSNIQDG